MPRMFFRDMKFRPRVTPAEHLPFGARSVGHYRVAQGSVEQTPPKHFVQIFWGIEGRGVVTIDNEERLLAPHHVAVYLPGMSHRLRAVSPIWEYRWWTVDGPMAGTIIAGLGLAADVYHCGPAPVARFDALTETLRDLSATAERRASARVYTLLCMIGWRPRPISKAPLIAQCLRIVHREWSDASLNVQTLARRLRTHRSTLSREFKIHTGISPVEYLSRLRVQNALSLLKETHDPVAEIAAQCGYGDANYFSRVIRRRTGQSPLQFRTR